MKSLKELYRIGKGPSSSHTIGPERACVWFQEKYKNATHFEVILYGSLAKTGEGHGTQTAIENTLKKVRVLRDVKTTTSHPNTMDLIAFENSKQLGTARVYSVGGGAIQIEGEPCVEGADVYNLNTLTDIRKYCETNGLRLYDYVFSCEKEDIHDYLSKVWQTMKSAVRRGVATAGILPGGLKVERRAKILYEGIAPQESVETREHRLVCAYAFAVSEENAAGGTIVTAPTCGSCGTLPSVLYHMQTRYKFSDERILRALATCGLIGNIVRHNASVSGAEVGCQGEVGVACAMAAAAVAQLMGGSPSQIEYAAEMGLEHHLGLTCDPVGGLVQIPCIERNAYAAARAMDAGIYALYTDGRHRVSFDQVVKVMLETGNDLPSVYKETSEGGLAKHLD